MKKLLFILLFIPSITLAQAAKDTTSEKTYVKRAYDALSNKDYKSCIEYYTDAINIDPARVLYYSNRATAKWDLKDEEGAIKDFKFAILLDAKYAWIYYNNIGLLKMDEKDNQSAIISFSKSIELHPNDAAYNNRALAELANENYRASIKDFTIAINSKKHKPSNTAFENMYGEIPYFLRAKAEFLGGYFKAALADLDIAINLKPDYILAYNARGEAKNKLGDGAGACADWQIAIKMGCEPAKENLEKFCSKK